MSRKSQETFRFKYHCNYDVSEIKAEIMKLEAEWLTDTSRQDSFDVHKETVTFFLTDFPLLWEAGNPYELTIREPNSKLWSLVQPIIEDLENINNGRVGRAIFPKLKAGKKIDGHTDNASPNAYLDVCRRYQIPIITNPHVYFAIDGGLLNMFEGECWEINNMRWHEVTNNSEKDRVHLLIDIIPNEYIGA